jgi:cytochrome c
MVGDVAAWTPRIAQGMDVLNDHAINGFTGEAGIMLPKGGRADLTDQEVMDAVAYMVAESQ